jgi:hypothetical protein
MTTDLRTRQVRSQRPRRTTRAIAYKRFEVQGEDATRHYGWLYGRWPQGIWNTITLMGRSKSCHWHP